MAWAEKTACRATLAPTGNVTSTILSLGATVDPGDVVVVAVTVGGGTTSTVSGLGATWTVKRVSTNSPVLAVFVGTGITASGTDITINTGGTVTMSAVATAFTGLVNDATVVGPSGSSTSAGATTTTTSAVSATQDRLLIGAASHAGSTTGNINAPTWSNSGTNTRAGTASGGSGITIRNSALDYTTSTTASVTATYTSSENTAFNAATVELIPAPPGGAGSLTLGGTVTRPNTASGSVTLGGSVTPPGAASAAGSLTLGGSGAAPVLTTGHLDLGSPAAAARPVYLATFTVDVGQESSDIPTLPADTPTADYVGNDDSDLVDYPDPVLDQWGRPIAS